MPNNDPFSMLKEMFSMAQAAQNMDMQQAQAQQMQEEATLLPLKRQQIENSLQNAQTNDEATNFYHQMAGLNAALPAIQMSGMNPQELRMLMSERFGLGDYDMQRAVPDYLKSLSPETAALVAKLQSLPHNVRPN